MTLRRWLLSHCKTLHTNLSNRPPIYTPPFTGWGIFLPFRFSHRCEFLRHLCPWQFFGGESGTVSQGRKKLSDSHKDFLVISCIIETFYVYCGMIILSKKQGASGTFSHRCENIRVTTIDSQGRASVRFQWTNSFSELVEQLLERFHTGVKIHRQTESCIKYSIGSWTKEIEVV